MLSRNGTRTPAAFDLVSESHEKMHKCPQTGSYHTHKRSASALILFVGGFQWWEANIKDKNRVPLPLTEVKITECTVYVRTNAQKLIKIWTRHNTCWWILHFANIEISLFLSLSLMGGAVFIIVARLMGCVVRGFLGSNSTPPFHTWSFRGSVPQWRPGRQLLSQSGVPPKNRMSVSALSNS